MSGHVSSELSPYLDGDLDEFIDALIDADQTAQLNAPEA